MSAGGPSPLGSESAPSTTKPADSAIVFDTHAVELSMGLAG